MSAALRLGRWLVYWIAPVVCSAQAWLPPQGEGSVALTSQAIWFNGHFDSRGQRQPIYQTQARSASLEAGYAVTGKLYFSASLPYVWTRFTAAQPPLNPSKADDGNYHGTLQDFLFEVRYNVFKQPFVLTPYFAAVLPSHDYEVIGEAAPGRNLHEYRVGLNAGRTLAPVLPRLYLHGRYTYTFAEKLLNISTNRSNADTEAGYFATPRVVLRLLSSWQRTHGGLHFEETIGHRDEFFNHDRLVRGNHWHLGGGVTVSLSDSVDVYASAVRFMAGSDTHYGAGIVFGASWSFSTRRAAAERRPGGAGAKTFR